MSYENAQITLNGQDLNALGGAKVTNVNKDADRETHDNSGFGDKTRNFKPGMKNWGLSFDVNLSPELDAFLWPLFDDATTITLEFLENKDAPVSAANPKWKADCFITKYNPVNGEVGSLRKATVDVVPTDGSVGPELQRLTA